MNNRPHPAAALPGGTYGDDPPLFVTNEFAEIRIRKVYTRNGERLEIESRRRGYAIQLDALELEGLTWQPKETFSQFLAASLGRDVAEDSAVENAATTAISEARGSGKDTTR